MDIMPLTALNKKVMIIRDNGEIESEEDPEPEKEEDPEEYDAACQREASGGQTHLEDSPPGLPPVRGIEHQIDFVPGSTLPNRPAYRTNPVETKELQRQVDELMEKGHIRESMSPVLFLFFLS
ncbi:unnamed protein product [Microthlaspi erraticum]|uniref:Reverse transcriptase domain-containing protein n=1 Tax=Microthlaspi erraticum TaxID=1685480 RepID=A0A6D2JV40_9BRAS|nr:unnamed protein product [Microthlaspi erraticum]